MINIGWMRLPPFIGPMMALMELYICYIYVSVYPSIHLSIYLSIYLYLSVYLFIYKRYEGEAMQIYVNNKNLLLINMMFWTWSKIWDTFWLNCWHWHKVLNFYQLLYQFEIRIKITFLMSSKYDNSLTLWKSHIRRTK